MKCPNCGKDINEGAKFCVGCGTSLIENKEVEVKEENIQLNNNNQKIEEVKEKVTAKVDDAKEAVKKAADSDFMKVVFSSLMFLLQVLLKPIKTIKAKIEYYANPKNGFILAGVVALSTMLIRVVISFVMALIKKSCTKPFFGEETCLTVGEKLKAIDWMAITLKHLLIILVAMFAVAGVYYIACLIAKKTTNFMRLLTITVVAFVPACLTSYLLLPILGGIGVHFSVIISVVGFVYSLVIFFTAIKDEFKFDNADQAIYFHLICISVIMIAVYFVLYNVVIGSVGSTINSLF